VAVRKVGGATGNGIVAQAEEITSKLEAASIDSLPLDPKWDRYRLRLTKADVQNQSDLLTKLLKLAYDRSGGQP
jgi:hypothetical protein